MNKKKSAFTLAEIMVTFVIVGILSALTVPQVSMYMRQAQYLNRLKKFYSTINQVFIHRMAQDGVTDVGQSSVISSISGESTNDGDQRNFSLEMMKLFKVISTFNQGSYTGNTFCAKRGDKDSLEENNNYTLILADGTIIRFDLKTTPEDSPYNNDSLDVINAKIRKIYGTIDVDINGDNKPNRWGDDCFRFVLAQNGLVYPYKGMEYAKFKAGDGWESSDDYWKNSKCKRTGSTGHSCAAQIIENDWEIEKDYYKDKFIE